jgi:L-ascorbate metabolism protein UlaG (beta-lactamase superfamily)
MSEPSTPRRRITWLGHATTLVDLDGTRLLTDPVLRSRVMHLRRAWPPDAAGLRGIDAVLVSHVHFDHLDLPSLERLGRSTPLVVPRGAGGLLRKRRFEHVVEMGVGEEIRVGAVTVVATEAAHRADRGPLGTKAPSLGYLARSDRTVYFAGDTDLFPGMTTLAGEGTIDLALLPISGWGATAGAGHLDPVRAAEALAMLRPRACVPIHWGTYSPIQWSAARRGLADLVADEFVRAAAQLAPDVTIHLLERNGVLTLD